MDQHQINREEAERKKLLKEISSKRMQRWLANEFMIEAYNGAYGTSSRHSMLDAATLVQAALALNPSLKLK